MAYSKSKHFVIYQLCLNKEEIQQGTPTYPAEWLRLKRKILNVGNSIKQVDLSYIGDGNVKWYNHLRNYFIKLNTYLPYDLAIPRLGIYPRETKIFD